MCKRVLILVLLSGMFSCQKKLTVLSAGQILSMQLVTGSQSGSGFPADNFTYAQIVASVDSSVVDTTTTIAFTTDGGSFSAGGASATAKVDLHGKATVFLKSRIVLAAHVQATVGGNYTQNVTVQFTTSYPDLLFINLPDTASNRRGSRLNFTTTLYKYAGLSSSGLTIAYTAVDTSGRNKGSFYNVVPSDSSGSASGQYWLDDSTYTGYIYIRGAVFNTIANDSVKTVNKIYIVK